jgi:hypothetical protein
MSYESIKIYIMENQTWKKIKLYKLDFLAIDRGNDQESSSLFILISLY